MTFEQLLEPRSHKMLSPGLDVTKWYVGVIGDDMHYLHKDLTVKYGTSEMQALEHILTGDGAVLSPEGFEKIYTGYFDSFEEAKEARDQYYKLNETEFPQ